MREMKNITQKSRCVNAQKHSIFLLSTPSIFEYIEHKYIYIRTLCCTRSNKNPLTSILKIWQNTILTLGHIKQEL